LCTQEKTGTYHLAKPKHDVIAMVNSLYDKGHKIVIFTARGMQTCNGDFRKIHDNYREMTEKWLEDNGVKYHKLLFGKVSGDYYVDDKGLSIEGFLSLVL